MKKNFRNVRGQALSEYLILVALVAVGSIGVVQLLARNLHGRLAQVSNDLGGYSSEKIDSIKAKEDVYKLRDLGDFGTGIENTSKSGN